VGAKTIETAKIIEVFEFFTYFKGIESYDIIQIFGKK
jgi:hypothetical protein